MKTDPFKGSPSPQTHESSHTNKRHQAIVKICDYLSTAPSEFSQRETYNLVQDYRDEYGRWSYSDVTNYIFDKSDDDALAVFTNNLSELLSYARTETEHAQLMGPDAHDSAKHIELMLDKFLDHANLAQRQKTLVYISDENFKKKFNECSEPFSVELSKELNKELISLVSIFTALSFLVFGGISSLDNIFATVGDVPIIELVIVGSVWGFCILNLVFGFVYLVSKLTKLPIRVVDDPEASLTRKYPFWVWSNFFLLFIFALFCWIYYIDYSNSGGWLLELSKENGKWVAIIGSSILILAFAAGAWLLLGCPRPNRNK